MSPSFRNVILGTLMLFSPLALAEDATAVRAAVEAGNANFIKGVQARSAAGMADSYEAGARLIPPGEPEVVGRPAIEKYWQGMLDQGIASVNLVIDELESGGDLAVERGHADLTFTDAQTPPSSVRYLVVWHRQADGTWKIRFDTWNDPPKPEPALQPTDAKQDAGGG